MDSEFSPKSAHVLYKATEFYHPESERTILWNDPDLNISLESQRSPRYF